MAKSKPASALSAAIAGTTDRDAMLHVPDAQKGEFSAEVIEDITAKIKALNPGKDGPLCPGCMIALFFNLVISYLKSVNAGPNEVARVARLLEDDFGSLAARAELEEAIGPIGARLARALHLTV